MAGKCIWWAQCGSLVQHTGTMFTSLQGSHVTVLAACFRGVAVMPTVDCLAVRFHFMLPGYVQCRRSPALKIFASWDTCINLREQCVYLSRQLGMVPASVTVCFNRLGHYTVACIFIIVATFRNPPTSAIGLLSRALKNLIVKSQRWNFQRTCVFGRWLQLWHIICRTGACPLM